MTRVTVPLMHAVPLVRGGDALFSCANQEQESTHWHSERHVYPDQQSCGFGFMPTIDIKLIFV